MVLCPITILGYALYAMVPAERENIRRRFDEIRSYVEEGVPEILLSAIKELSDLCRAHFPTREP